MKRKIYLVGIAWDAMIADIKASPTFWGRVLAAEAGAIDIGGILVMGIGMVFIAVGFIIFPIIMTATDALLAYSYSLNGTCQASLFTGFNAIVGITPLLVLVGFLSAGVFAMYLGLKVVKGEGSTKLDLGSMLMLGISMIFIAIGLIILPVVLDAICGVLHGIAGAGLNVLYVGLSPILLVTPLLVLISFVAGAVVSGFFGIKRLGAGD